MKLYQIVLKDIFSRKRRVFYATLGVVIGTMTVIAILTIAMAGQERIYSQLEKYGANLTVVPATRNLNTRLGDLNVGTLTIGEYYIPQQKIQQIREIADGEIRKALNIQEDGYIATIAPRLYIASEVNGMAVTLVGIDPQEELKIKTWWQIYKGNYLENSEGAMLGKISAELLNLGPGSKIQIGDQEFVAEGILDETGSDEDYQIFVSLTTLQKLFDKEGLVSFIDIRALCNACPAEYIADEINKEIPGVRAVAVKQIAANEMGMLEKLNKFMLALAGVTLIVGAFGVVNTLMTSIFERKKDIGIMRAVGASRNQIIKAVVYEAVVIGIAGGILGYVAGTLLAYILGPLILEGAPINYALQYLPISLAIAVLLSVLATLYPAYRATKIRVADSFRSL